MPPEAAVPDVRRVDFDPFEPTLAESSAAEELAAANSATDDGFGAAADPFAAVSLAADGNAAEALAAPAVTRAPRAPATSGAESKSAGRLRFDPVRAGAASTGRGAFTADLPALSAAGGAATGAGFVAETDEDFFPIVNLCTNFD